MIEVAYALGSTLADHGRMRAPLLLLFLGAGLLLAAPPANAVGVPLPDDTAPAQEVSSPRFSADRVIVRFRAGLDAADREQVRDEVGAQDFQGLGRRFQVVTLAEGADPQRAVAELSANPDVLDASRDGYAELLATNDPLFDQLWGLQNQGLNVGGVATSTLGRDINAVGAWAKTTGDKDVVVAVLDDGYRPQHPDLKDRLWGNVDEVPGDSIDNDGNGFVDDVHGMDFVGVDAGTPTTDNDPTDDLPNGGHGVHVAGTIAAAGNNGVGITGVAQQASIMPLRVCGADWSSGGAIICPVSSIIAAINYAGANGARVANLSLGGPGFNALFRDAFAANPNTLFVIAAGNDGRNSEVPGYAGYPCSYDPSTSSIPGAVDNIVCVAASDQNDAKAYFSNWGAVKVDVAAPGTEILSTYVRRDWVSEDFAAGSPVGWSLGGWSRVSGSPLLSFGMSNGNQPDQTTRILTTPTVTTSGPSTCTLTYWRKLTSAGNDDRATSDKFTVSGLLDGSEVDPIVQRSQSARQYSYGIYLEGFGTRQVAAQFAFRKGLGTPATNGVWIDDVKLSCFAPPGQEDASSYGFLQGTSMASPQVAGVAALLVAYEPTATVAQMRGVLISTVDPVAAFDPVTGQYPISSGGRVDADAALTALDTAVAPQTQFTREPGATSGTSASFAFKTTSRAPATFQCRLDGGAWSPCASTSNLTDLSVGPHTFSVRAQDATGNADRTPARHTWSVVGPAVPVPPEAPAAPAPPAAAVDPPATVGSVSGLSAKRTKKGKAATLRWQAVANATRYEYGCALQGKQVGRWVSTTATTATCARLKPTKAYRVFVRAVGPDAVSAAAVITVRRWR